MSIPDDSDFSGWCRSLLVPAGDRRWRIGLGLHGGGVPLGELFRQDETCLALGLWLDP